MKGVKMGFQENDENVVNLWEQSHYHRFIIASSQKSVELSDTWHKLLGAAPESGGMINATDNIADIDDVLVTPSSFADDPWSELIHSHGVEMVDLQQSRLADV